jgi:hypothetical protein
LRLLEFELGIAVATPGLLPKLWQELRLLGFENPEIAIEIEALLA